MVNAAPAPGGGFFVLVVAAVADVQKGKMHLHDHTSPLLAFHSLPYPFLEE
jgi:hypothetical protein